MALDAAEANPQSRLQQGWQRCCDMHAQAP
jgi:hypothetical protein